MDTSLEAGDSHVLTSAFTGESLRDEWESA